MKGSVIAGTLYTYPILKHTHNFVYCLSVKHSLYLTGMNLSVARNNIAATENVVTQVDSRDIKESRMGSFSSLPSLEESSLVLAKHTVLVLPAFTKLPVLEFAMLKLPMRAAKISTVMIVPTMREVMSPISCGSCSSTSS